MNANRNLLRRGLLVLPLLLGACGPVVKEGDLVQTVRDLQLLSDLRAAPEGQCGVKEGQPLKVVGIQPVHQGAAAEDQIWVHVTGGPENCGGGWAIWDGSNFEQ